MNVNVIVIPFQNLQLLLFFWSFYWSQYLISKWSVTLWCLFSIKDGQVDGQRIILFIFLLGMLIWNYKVLSVRGTATAKDLLFWITVHWTANIWKYSDIQISFSEYCIFKCAAFHWPGLLSMETISRRTGKCESWTARS